ncbi:hypothetical protein BJ973_002840 [Actinoplanes tereljensis]|uniref:DUF732 domain-containing protein n=1 Tax=Paractinoplanes tereljensis TaxID=571912 RepID=A0A919NR64_9ACTN|nr:hypothetical protein [Actinoplanes tereljensis]GIF22514.1 hypothetical protein Ate02nite_52440 [Actinoplanes tereljensis]
MHLTHVAMAAAVTVSVAGVSYAALDPAELEAKAQVVADQASCRTVDTAIVAYLALNDTQPESITDLAGYVKGDITAYSIVDGLASGPGC